MMKLRLTPWLVLAGLRFVPSAVADVPRTIAFQGVLTNAARVPLPDGAYPNISFRLYDHLTGPSQLWQETKTVTLAGGHGVFATALGDATAFPSNISFDQPYWVSVQVGADPEMAPRLPLQSVPYALNAWNIGGNSGTNSADSFLGTTDSQPLVFKSNGHRTLLLQDVVNAASVRSANVLLGSEANSIAAGVIGGTVGGGGSATGINDLRGDFGVIGGGTGNFVDAFPNAVIAGGSGNIAQGANTVIGGGRSNNVQADGVTIAGGISNYGSAENGSVGGGKANSVQGRYGTVGGGGGNLASGDSAVVAGGDGNAATSMWSSVGGGLSNRATQSRATIGGGDGNTASGTGSVIAGGSLNVSFGENSAIGGGTANTSPGERSAVGGGLSNNAGAPKSYVAGGELNTIGAFGAWSVIGGGYNNRVTGGSATIPGGTLNNAYDYAFAAGYRAKAYYTGSFVWSDYSADVDFYSSANNQFCIRAAGGMVMEMGGSPYIFTGTGPNELNRSLLLFNSQGRLSASGLKAGGILCADDYGFASPDKNGLVVKGSIAIGTNSSGGRALYVNGLAGGTTGWNSASDARLKTNVSTISAPLDTIESLRGVTFDWRPDTGHNLPQGRQIGFIAQEVERVLPSVVATDDQGYKSVAYANVVPVLVEAVKALKADNDALRAQNASLETRLRRIEARLDAVGRTPVATGSLRR